MWDSIVLVPDLCLTFYSEWTIDQNSVLEPVCHISNDKTVSLAAAALERYIQSTLVISTSVISNNRLSRRKNLVLV